MEFIATIFQKGNNLGIEVPENIIDKLGAGKKPPVVVTINKYTYQNTVAVMQGKYLIALNSEHRKFVTVNGGDRVKADIKLDKEPRNIELPIELVSRLNKNKKANIFFESLAPSSKKKISLLITSSKTDETRNKRLHKVISDLEQKIKP